jgi:hypothetical protein
MARAAVLGRPREFWAWLEEQTRSTPSEVDKWVKDHPLTPWKCESVWMYMLGDPVKYPTRVGAAAAIPEEVKEAMGDTMKKRPCNCGGKTGHPMIVDRAAHEKRMAEVRERLARRGK